MIGTGTEGAIYAASKAAILSITRSFAAALAPRSIRVNAVCPGLVDTPMQDQIIEFQSASRGLEPGALVEARLRSVLLGRMASPDEVAAVICFLLSPESSYMTGQAINITGGLVSW